MILNSGKGNLTDFGVWVVFLHHNWNATWLIQRYFKSNRINLLWILGYSTKHNLRNEILLNAAGFTCSKLTTETLEQVVKYLQS